MQKLYCYVDETGQDTEGAFFLVSVVITQPERDKDINLLKAIEQQTGKGRVKWARAKDVQRIAYITAVLQEQSFKGHLYFAMHRNSLRYQEMTIDTAAQAITAHAEKPYRATVIIDGLPKTLYRSYTVEFRKRDVQADKVRGANDDQDALLRLADALCGFIRDATEGKPSLQKLLEEAINRGYIVQVGFEPEGE